jgi:hypothetical protein
MDNKISPVDGVWIGQTNGVLVRLEVVGDYSWIPESAPEDVNIGFDARMFILKGKEYLKDCHDVVVLSALLPQRPMFEVKVQWRDKTNKRVWGILRKKEPFTIDINDFQKRWGHVFKTSCPIDFAKLNDGFTLSGVLSGALQEVADAVQKKKKEIKE